MTDPATPHLTRPTVNSQITAITVYTDRALVTRRGKVTLTGQEQELVLANLPLTLQPESVRASGSGTIAVRLLGVRTERIYATEPVADRVAQLTEQIQQLEDQQRRRQDTLAALQLQLSFVQNLGSKSVDRFSRSLAQQQVTLAQTGELLSFLGHQHGEFSAAIAQEERQLRELEQQLQALRAQLQQVSTPRPRESYSLSVAIAPAGAGEFELEVSYVCNRASWAPLYDLQVNTARSSLHLSYLAEVQQTTGEDWTGVALTLSTAKPGLGMLPPQLAPWYIDVFSAPLPIAPPAMARSAKAAAPGILMQSLGMPAEEDATWIEAQPVTAQVSSDGGVVTFQVGGNSDIPGDGASHKITVFEADYPGHLEHVAVPKLVSFAYLQAIVTNPSGGATLLAGKANIFRDSTFVGTTHLDNVAPGQEFKLNLGIDESLKLERALVERDVDKRFLGNQRRITYAYRITIANLQDHVAKLKLSEQLPVSRNEQIKVRLIRSAPQLQPGEMGLLEWALELQPQAKQEVYYQFTIEHPRELTIVGLEI